MVNVFLDTNILIDAMIPGRPQHAEAVTILLLHSQRTITACISASSLKDIYYISRKELPKEKIIWFISWFLDNLVVYPIDESICRAAIHSDEPDFEDGIMRAIAEQNCADFIVTRDGEAYRDSRIQAMNAESFLDNSALGK